MVSKKQRAAQKKQQKSSKNNTSPDWNAMKKRANERYFSYEGKDYSRCIISGEFCDILGKDTVTGPEMLHSEEFQLRMKYIGDADEFTEAVVWDNNGDVLVLNDVQQRIYLTQPPDNTFLFAGGRGRGKPMMVYQSGSVKGAGMLMVEDDFM